MTKAVIEKELAYSKEEKCLNVAMVRHDFPILNQKINQHPLVYLDNAATTQKPNTVLEAMSHYYHWDNANIHRGVHTLSVRATESFEAAREQVKQFINAEYTHEIIFTRGATESINLIAQTFARSELKAGDEIIISAMEHHSNIVPWQLVCEQVGAKLKVIPITDLGELDITAYMELFTEKTKIVSVAHVSNAIGTINPVAKIVEIAHQHNVPVLLDGAQAAPHMQIDVQKLDCDFYVFSSHKMYGPTGIGVLYGKTKWLDRLPPYEGGGDMIAEVSFEKTSYNKLPHKFEAGTPNIAGVIGLGAAIDYLNRLTMAAVSRYEDKLLQYATESLTAIEGLRIIGRAQQKAAVISFVIDDIHPHDIGTVLDHEGIAIRAGHHCAMPLMTRFNIAATARASFGIYNTLEEIDALVAALLRLKRLFN
ncbi:MAG: cysteine desulfurase [Gammaproteobacteria bacterium]|nr:cysteine desulfurase [Gammaproteobacteria bacterium]